MPVYNCPDYVGAAIESILGQSFTDFELVLIDDGSSDHTPTVLDRYRDSRIRRYTQSNRGLAATLNRAIELSRAPLLARQDQDDLSEPDRLAKQVAYMDSHPDCGLLGGWAQIMVGDRLSDRYHRHPTDASELRYGLLFNNPFVHSSVMLRKSVVIEIGGYSEDPSRQPPEDYELWSRMSRVAEIANLPENLLVYREIPTSMSRDGVSPFQQRLIRLCAENLAAAAAVPQDDPAVQALAILTHAPADLLDRSPDFHRMRMILSRAIQGCVGSEPRPDLEQDADARITNLRAVWFASHTPLAAVLQRQGRLRNLAKSVWGLLRRWPRR